MKKNKLNWRTDDEEFRIDLSNEKLVLACCECGLVHEINLSLVMSARRDNKWTSNLRRSNKFKAKPFVQSIRSLKEKK